jgi:hypothetical protein
MTASSVVRRSCRVALFAAIAVAGGLTAFDTTAVAETYVCPPAAQGVPGLLGGPKFAETVLPDAFASELGDPRWTGAWREDFPTSLSTEVGSRMLKEGNVLFVSLEGKVDPNDAAVNSDGVYLGFSRDGVTAEMVKVTLSASPPLKNSPAVSSINWWKTTDGGATPWPKQGGPLPWARSSNIHAWAAPASTGNGDSWAINAKIDLADVGTHLDAGPPLVGNFYMWYEIVVQTATGPAAYDWPSGTTLSFDGMSQALLTAKTSWGIVNPSVTSNCPGGVSVGPMSLGVAPVVAGVPGTVVHFGTGQPSNDFVAELDGAGMPVVSGTVKARFRIANWPETMDAAGDWHDMVPTPGNGVPGTRNNAAGEIRFHCVNPPDNSDAPCYQLPAGAPASQCVLVELSQASGTGVKFVRDSAYACIEMSDGTHDAGAPDVRPSDGATIDGEAGVDVARLEGGMMGGGNGSGGGGFAGTSGAVGGFSGSTGQGGAAGDASSCSCTLPGRREQSRGASAVLGIALLLFARRAMGSRR